MRKQLQEQKEQIIISNSNLATDLQKQSIAVSALMQTEVYSKFHSAANDSTFRPDAGDWEVLRKKVDTCYNNFTGRLHSIYDISDMDMKVCLLLKINITITGISIILNRSKSAIVSARKKMYRKTHGEEGKPEMWDNFITSL